MGESIGPWRRLHRRIAYENEWIEVFDDEVVRPDGAPGVYGVVHPRTLGVAVVALDADDSVLLVGQHRYTLDLLSWEIPGGGVGFDEDPLEGAKRELAEETGATAGTWRELARFTLATRSRMGAGSCSWRQTWRTVCRNATAPSWGWNRGGCPSMRRCVSSTPARSMMSSPRLGSLPPTVTDAARAERSDVLRSRRTAGGCPRPSRVYDASSCDDRDTERRRARGERGRRRCEFGQRTAVHAEPAHRRDRGIDHVQVRACRV